MSAKLYTARVAHIESSCYSPFFLGTLDQALLAAAKLAHLAGKSFHGWAQEDQFQAAADMEDVQGGDTAVFPAEEAGDLAARDTVLDGGEAGLYFSYLEKEEGEDFRDGFLAPEGTRFRAGDRLVMVDFSPGVPCSWLVADEALTFTEEWAEGQVPA